MLVPCPRPAVSSSWSWRPEVSGTATAIRLRHPCHDHDAEHPLAGAHPPGWRPDGRSPRPPVTPYSLLIDSLLLAGDRTPPAASP